MQKPGSKSQGKARGYLLLELVLAMVFISVAQVGLLNGFSDASYDGRTLAITQTDTDRCRGIVAGRVRPMISRTRLQECMPSESGQAPPQKSPGGVAEMVEAALGHQAGDRVFEIR